jgi:6-phosphogluconolactonase
MNNLDVEPFTDSINAIASQYIQEFLCDDRASLYDKAANRIASQLTRGIEKQGRASFIVPGGTTPAPVFERLSNISLLWHNVLVAPSDERWLPVTHEHSNQFLINQTLRVNHAADAQLMSLKNAAVTARISVLPQPFDVVVVGMGNDGHFASLFPGSKPIADALDPKQVKKCMAIDATGCAVAGQYPERMTLTLSAILNSKLIMVLMTGKEKLNVLRQAEAEKDPLLKPIAALLMQQQTPVEIYWAE